MITIGIFLTVPANLFCQDDIYGVYKSKNSKVKLAIYGKNFYYIVKDQFNYDDTLSFGSLTYFKDDLILIKSDSSLFQTYLPSIVKEKHVPSDSLYIIINSEYEDNVKKMRGGNRNIRYSIEFYDTGDMFSKHNEYVRSKFFNTNRISIPYTNLDSLKYIAVCVHPSHKYSMEKYEVGNFVALYPVNEGANSNFFEFEIIGFNNDFLLNERIYNEMVLVETDKIYWRGQWFYKE
jgi:hypothetical protein